jgi:membrane protein required for colicin V production
MDVDVDLKLSIFDFLVSGALLWGIYKGFMQGFIVHAIAMLFLLVGVFISAKLSMGFYNLLVDKSTVSLKNLPVIAFSLMFGLVLYGTNWGAIQVQKQVVPVRMNMYTKLLGSFFGALKYLFIASVFLIFIDRIDRSFKIRTEKERQRTIMYQPVLHFAPAIMPILNFDVRQATPMELDDYTSDPDQSDSIQ